MRVSERKTLRKKVKPSADADSTAADRSASSQILLETYWDSPEAKKLFLGNSTDNRSVVDVLRQRIQRLQQVNRTQDGWRDLVDKHDVDNLCSAYDVFIIRQRCCILCLAYIFALEEMNSVRWVEDCCSQAIAVGWVKKPPQRLNGPLRSGTYFCEQIASIFPFQTPRY